MKRVVTLTFLALFSMGSLTACNTMAGLGEDVEQAGDELTEEARECKNGDTGADCL